jgi:hypothetical protein
VPTVVPVLFVLVETLVQEMSYCETPKPLLLFCPVLYAVPPLPPLTLLMPGSLWTEPGDVAELPGLAALPWQLAPWGLGSPYAGAAPITAMAIMQPAENSLCLIFFLRSGRAAQRTHIWVHDLDGRRVQ